MFRSGLVRAAALMLALSLAWLAVGAPVQHEEWVDLPGRAARLVRQLPARTLPVWRCWLAWPGNDSRAPIAEGSLSLRVWDEAQSAVRLLALEQYVYGVVAAEMPAGYAPEALKSQAVAARTRAVWSCAALGGRGCASHPECDVCTSPGCCQGWLSDSALHARWGDAYDEYAQRTARSVVATQGMILTYDGLPAEVLYHACSGGQTEDAAAVFSQAVPYLICVDSPGEEANPRYATEACFSFAEAADKLNAAFPDCGVSAEDLAGQLELRSSTASGRAATIRVGREVVDAAALRRALGLNSTRFTWDADEKTITFHVVGYGHGVGMSQAGAQAMASEGALFPEILAHYYPGTQLAVLPEPA